MKHQFVSAKLVKNLDNQFYDEQVCGDQLQMDEQSTPVTQRELNLSMIDTHTSAKDSLLDSRQQRIMKHDAHMQIPINSNFMPKYQKNPIQVNLQKKFSMLDKIPNRESQEQLINSKIVDIVDKRHNSQNVLNSHNYRQYSIPFDPKI